MKQFLFLICLIFQYSVLATDLIISDLDSADKIIDVSGKDGHKGEGGYSGHDEYESGGRTVWATDGGDGSNGGKGEDGKSILFRYDKLEQLKLFKINAKGGSGGAPGRGGSGGAPTGNDGEPGDWGEAGKTGSIYLMQSSIQYTADLVSRDVKISDAIEKPFSVHKNIWLKKNGAKALLANDSIVTDHFFEFVGAEQKEIHVHADPSIDAKILKKSNLLLEFDGQNTKVKFPGTLVDYSLIELNNIITIKINQLLDIESILKVSGVKVSGIGRNLTLSFTKENSDFDLKNAEVSLRIARPVLFSYSTVKTVFSQKNINSFVSEEDGVVKVAIGQTNLAKRYKMKGKKISISLLIKTHFLGKDIIARIYIDHRIGRKTKNITIYYNEVQ